MVETTARLLGVLSALQSSPRWWSGPELAERFGVTARTVRRDVDRLRQLGYAIEAAAGLAGGYRIGAGGRALPPLMLERDEAVAIAAALRAAGAGDDAASALAKLERFLPSTTRSDVAAVGSMTTTLGGRDLPLDSALLVTVTKACRDGERLRLDYEDRAGVATERTVIPLRVVHAAGRWYLVAYDRDRRDWRSFRLSRVTAAVPVGHRAPPPDPPDPHRFVQEALSSGPYRHRAHVRFHASVEELAQRIPATAAVLEPIDDGTTMVSTGSDDLEWMAMHLAAVGFDFDVVHPDELVDVIRAMGARLARVGRQTDATSGRRA